MFSGAQQLVEWFFVELAAQMKLRPSIAEVGEAMETFGEAFSGLGWVPGLGPWVERLKMASTAVAKIMRRKKGGIGELRNKVKNALTVLDKPVVVVLDDIDRLTTSEIRDIFKLVRVTANFPNVIYILAFDRTRVENALNEQQIPGRDYLEKILQVAVDLPVAPVHVLDREVISAIETAVSKVEKPGPFDENVWQFVLVEVIRPLIRNMRDVRRYTAAIDATVRDLNGHIALVDVLALEAVRVFLPDVFRQMYESIDGLTTGDNSNLGGLAGRPHLREQVDRLIEVSCDHVEVTRALISRLFPVGQRHIGGISYSSGEENQWLVSRNVAHREILRLYFERVGGTSFHALIDAEQCFSRMDDREGFDACLRSLDPDRFREVVSTLEAYEDQFTQTQVLSGSIVLLNFLPEIPDSPEHLRGMFDLGIRFQVNRLVYRLVRSLKDQHVIEKVIREILPQISSLSSKMGIIGIIGHRENRGHKLISQSAASEFETEWRNEVCSATPDFLEKEVQLLRVLLVAKREADSSEPNIPIPNSPAITFAILRSGRTYVRSQARDSHPIDFSPRLPWDALVELYGDPDTLRRRLQPLFCFPPNGSEELVELARKYLGGWRPEN